MQAVRSVVALLVAAGAVAGCGSAGPPLSDPAPGLLAEATAASSGDCPGGDVLATVLDSTGVTYDYQPTDSPRELALTMDAVVRGRLTGRVERVTGEAGPALDLGVDVQDLVLGEELAGMTPPLSRLRITVSPAQLPGADTTVPALEGVEVVAFITTAPHGDDESGAVGVPAAVEGLMASCGDRGLVGWRGDGPGWSLPDLDAVSLGALGLPEDVEALEGDWEQEGGGEPGLEVARGPEHCGLESTVIAGVGSYDRMFVRDPEGVISSGLVGTLELEAPATDGPLTVVWGGDGSAVRFALVDGEDGLAVDLGDGRRERWPEIVPVFGCA